MSGFTTGAAAGSPLFAAGRGGAERVGSADGSVATDAGGASCPRRGRTESGGNEGVPTDRRAGAGVATRIVAAGRGRTDAGDAPTARGAGAGRTAPGAGAGGGGAACAPASVAPPIVAPIVAPNAIARNKKTVMDSP